MAVMELITHTNRFPVRRDKDAVAKGEKCEALISVQLDIELRYLAFKLFGAGIVYVSGILALWYNISSNMTFLVCYGCCEERRGLPVKLFDPVQMHSVVKLNRSLRLQRRKRLAALLNPLKGYLQVMVVVARWLVAVGWTSYCTPPKPQPSPTGGVSSCD